MEELLEALESGNVSGSLDGVCLASVARSESGVEFVTSAVLVPAIVLLGLACNALNIAVLLGHRARMASSAYLLGISVADSAFLVFGLAEVAPLHVPSLATDPGFNKAYMHVVLGLRLCAAAAYKASVL